MCLNALVIRFRVPSSVICSSFTENKTMLDSTKVTEFIESTLTQQFFVRPKALQNETNCSSPSEVLIQCQGVTNFSKAWYHGCSVLFEEKNVFKILKHLPIAITFHLKYQFSTIVRSSILPRSASWKPGFLK